jgi:NADPH:quinone reductase-like Zn-dependent oxidoreductase
MLAITYHQYGSPQVLKQEQLAKPIPNQNQILIKIMATTVNTGDVRIRRADPWLARLVFGILFAGIVERVGANVTSSKIGDEVFGINVKTLGCFAEYVVIESDTPIALKPHNCTFEEAAAAVFGGHTALHFIKKAQIKEGQKTLIYGASGSVGTSAIQIAKYYGANVTAVTSVKNFDLVKNLGADDVIDYTNLNWLQTGQKYDVLYETVNKTPIFKIAKLVKPNGTLILGAVIIKGMLEGFIASQIYKFKLIGGVADVNAKDMDFLKELIETGKLKPTIDQIFELEQMAEAHYYVDAGHKKGNVVIKINHYK